MQARLMLLAALTGEHIVFLGPPGTAKSELGRRLAGLCAGRFFGRLLTRFSVPEVTPIHECSMISALTFRAQYDIFTGISELSLAKAGSDTYQRRSDGALHLQGT